MDNGGHRSISTTRQTGARNCRKLIGAVKQLVIFVLADSLINCRCGHLDHLSCLGEPHFITVREAQDGQRLLRGQEAAIISLSLTRLSGIHWFVMLMHLWEKLEMKKTEQIQSSLDSSRNPGIWHKWMFQRVYVNANNNADGIANVPSLWLMFSGRNMLYNPYLLQMLSIKTKRLTFERYLINQWMEFCVHSIGLSNLQIPLGRPVINAISVFFLSSQAALMFSIFRDWSGTFTWQITLLCWRYKDVLTVTAFHWLLNATWYCIDSFNQTAAYFHYEHRHSDASN